MAQSRRIAEPNLAFQYEIRRNPYLVDYERERNMRMQKKRVAERCAKAQKRAQVYKAFLIMGMMFVAVLGIYLFMKSGRADVAENGSQGGQPKVSDTQGLSEEDYAKHPQWTENFLTPNEYSRPGEPLTEIKSVFVHYTANPGTSAAQNRSYFERQKDEHKASVSSHFIIGYEGEIIQCVPLNEIAYAVKSRNYDSVSIECCHKEKDGSFTQETYDSLISLLAWLTEVYDLDTEDILRHYDCGGKLCPLYYTEHEDEWEQLKLDVSAKTAAKQR